MTTHVEFPQVRYRVPSEATQILLVRHGESQPYVPGQPFDAIEDGTGDPPLAPEGFEGAEQVAQRLADEPITALYATPLLRTRQTAAPLAAATGLTPTLIADLQEVHLGEWERGVSRQFFAENHPIAQRARRERRWDVIPGAESSEAFATRVRRGIEHIAAHHRGELVAAFLHGGVIGEILSLATGGERFVFRIDNASISNLVIADDGWRIFGANDTSHRNWSVTHR